MKPSFFLLVGLALAALACVMPWSAQPTVQPTETASSSISETETTPVQPAAELPEPTATEAPGVSGNSAPQPVLTPNPARPNATEMAAGDLAYFYGDWETAGQQYQAVLNGLPDEDTRLAAWLGLGKVYYRMGDQANSLNALRQITAAPTEWSRSAEAYFYLAKNYELLDRHLDAAEAYLNYLARRSGVIDAYVYEARGDALFAAGDYPAALIDYRAAYESPRLGNTLGIELKMARTYAIIGDFGTALVMYDDIYQRTTSPYLKASVDWLKGQLYTAQNQPDLAYAAYLDAVENFPEAYDSYLGLVILVNDGYPVNELSRGLVDYYAGEYGVAVAAFDRYLSAAPAYPGTAYYFRGLALSALTNYDAAIQSWEAVIAGYADSEYWDEAWEQKAYYQWAYFDDYEGAKQTLLDFVAASPAHARAAEFLFDAARVAERSGQLELAVDLWERSAVEYPNSGYTFRSLFLEGLTYYRLGLYPQAKATFSRANAYAPTLTDNASIYLWMGKSLAAQGDAQAARAAWEQASAFDPTGYYSERARDLLAGRAPFEPPESYDLGIDWPAEKAAAEAWLKAAFLLPAETELAGLGELQYDARFGRGAEFWRLGLYDEARDEFEALRVGVETDVVQTYRLIGYFYEIGLYRSAIFAARQVLTLAGMNDAQTMDAPAFFNHVRFGVYFADLVFPAALENDVHPLLVWSVMRQESFYEPFIGSSAGARGLMQIMPATGQAVADQLAWPAGFSAADLYRPLVSIRLGVEYLDQQRDGLGEMVAALAAYNGGPGNSAIWQSLASGDPDLMLEIIRFDETRTYIKRIYEIYTIYLNLYTHTP